MKKTLRVLASAMIFLSLTAYAEQASRWEAAIAKFEARDVLVPPAPGQILFVGSSSVRFWLTLEHDMTGLPVLNRGFGGSQFSDLIDFTPRIVLPYRPSVIAVYEGDNDIAAGKTSDRVVADFNSFVAMVRAELPNTRICFIAIKPSLSRAAMWPEMSLANAQIAAIAENDPTLCYLDVAGPMLDESGDAKPELFVEDGLHMNADGYRIWTEVVRPQVEALYKERSTP
ncbi:MAG: SGNH/GDSL hydrolase family protein [Gammaproteobacteria bacterium]|nr:SGNH/GDSL hydrolase family protein [Gammaproteobacteria bacterium]